MSESDARPEESVSEADKIELRFLERLSDRLPEDLEILRAKADLYTKTGRYEAGLAADLRLSREVPGDETVWYNLGCSFALTGRIDEAFESLSHAIELGYADYDWMKGDPDLCSLRSDPRFEALLEWLYETVFSERE